jgi:hypothetical protein
VNNKPKTRTLKRAPITYRQKQLLMAVLIKSSAVFRAISDKLQSTHFRELDDRPFVIVYDVVKAYHTQTGELPTTELLNTEISARLEDDPELLTGEQIAEVDTLLSISAEIEIGQQERKAAIGYAKRLLEEALHIELYARADSSAGFSDLPALLTEVRTRADSIAALDAGAAQPFFPVNPADMPPTVIETTGLVWLDSFMNGGMTRREVYGFLGPYGSCKTTLSVMLCVNRARFDQSKYAANEPLPLVYLVAWEEEREQLQFRGMSYAARIHKESLVGADWYSSLSTTGNYKQYEIEKLLPPMEGKELPGEKQRLHAAIEQLNKNMVSLDFTGADKTYRDLSCNMVPGVAAAIEADQAARGNPGVSLIVMDYAGAAAKKHVSKTGQDADRMLRHVIGDMPLTAKWELAIPFDCPVWIMHQMGTEAQSKGAAVLPKATDAAESRNFLENLNFGFMLGTVTDENTCAIVARKQRRAARAPYKILKISGEFASVSDVSKEYSISAGGITKKGFGEEIADDEDSDTKKKAFSPPPVVQDSLFSEVKPSGIKPDIVRPVKKKVLRRKRKDPPRERPNGL